MAADAESGSFGCNPIVVGEDTYLEEEDMSSFVENNSEFVLEYDGGFEQVGSSWGWQKQ